MKAKKKTAPKKTKREYALVLRTCAPDMSAYNSFVWPESGKVEAPDWSPTASCGNGLHGLLWGVGNAGMLNWNDDAKWLVVKVDTRDLIVIDDQKVKFRAGTVVCCGDRAKALEYIQANTPNYKGVGAKSTAGDRGQATAGDRGQATAGDRGQATAGYSGQATAGYSGQATAGYSGQATAGDRGQATAGYRGQAKAGIKGTLIIRWFDYNADRYRAEIGYVGETLDAAGVALKPGVFYRLDDQRKFAEVA